MLILSPLKEAMTSILASRCEVAAMPDALHELISGFCELASLMAATLGPGRGPIWNAHDDGVERISQSGVAARRVVEVPGRLRNAGAMQLRHLVWRMHEHFGDGGATAAVLARAMVREGERLIAAGIDPLALGEGMRAALNVAIATLERQRLPDEYAGGLSHLVATVVDDSAVASVLSEMYDLLGDEAAIHLEVMSSPWLDRHYVEGGYWRAQPAARTMIPTGVEELVIDTPAFLIVDDDVLDVDDLLPVLDLVARDPARRPLLIIGAKLGERSLEFLRLNNARGAVSVSATSPKAVGASRHQVLMDMAVITGAELVSRTRGHAPGKVHPAWLGTAAKAILTSGSVTILGGGGNPESRHQRAQSLREQLARTVVSDETAALRERLSSLVGGVGILQIGGLTQAERDDKRRHIEHAIKVLPGLIEAGLVPGGGAAYLESGALVRKFQESLGSSEQRFGVDLLRRALEAPFLQIVRNEGCSVPPVMLDRVLDKPPGTGFDARTGMLAPMAEAGIVDSLAVVRGALQMAVSAAAELLTIGAIVLPREAKREISVDP